MKAVKINLAGAERYLAFTGEAMFRLRDEFGDVTSLVEALKPDTRESLSTAARAAAILAEQGELARRHMGYTETAIVDAETILTTTTPAGIPLLKMSVIAAIELGYGRDIRADSDEIDLGLAELNAQKKTT